MKAEILIVPRYRTKQGEATFSKITHCSIQHSNELRSISKLANYNFLYSRVLLNACSGLALLHIWYFFGYFALHSTVYFWFSLLALLYITLIYIFYCIYIILLCEANLKPREPCIASMYELCYTDTVAFVPYILNTQNFLTKNISLASLHLRETDRFFGKLYVCVSFISSLYWYNSFKSLNSKYVDHVLFFPVQLPKDSWEMPEPADICRFIFNKWHSNICLISKSDIILTYLLI